MSAARNLPAAAINRMADEEAFEPPRPNNQMADEEAFEPRKLNNQMADEEAFEPPRLTNQMTDEEAFGPLRPKNRMADEESFGSLLTPTPLNTNRMTYREAFGTICTSKAKKSHIPFTLRKRSFILSDEYVRNQLKVTEFEKQKNLRQPRKPFILSSETFDYDESYLLNESFLKQNEYQESEWKVIGDHQKKPLCTKHKP